MLEELAKKKRGQPHTLVDKMGWQENRWYWKGGRRAAGKGGWQQAQPYRRWQYPKKKWTRKFRPKKRKRGDDVELQTPRALNKFRRENGQWPFRGVGYLCARDFLFFRLNRYGIGVLNKQRAQAFRKLKIVFDAERKRRRGGSWREDGVREDAGGDGVAGGGATAALEMKENDETIILEDDESSLRKFFDAPSVSAMFCGESFVSAARSFFGFGVEETVETRLNKIATEAVCKKNPVSFFQEPPKKPTMSYSTGSLVLPDGLWPKSDTSTSSDKGGCTIDRRRCSLHKARTRFSKSSSSRSLHKSKKIRHTNKRNRGGLSVSSVSGASTAADRVEDDLGWTLWDDWQEPSMETAEPDAALLETLKSDENLALEATLFEKLKHFPALRAALRKQNGSSQRSASPRATRWNCELRELERKRPEERENAAPSSQRSRSASRATRWDYGVTFSNIHPNHACISTPRDKACPLYPCIVIKHTHIT